MVGVISHSVADYSGLGLLGLPDGEYLQSVTATFTAGANGTLSGNVSQEVLYGGSCTAVEAVPDEDCTFGGWTGGRLGEETENPLVLDALSEDLELTADFLFGGPTSNTRKAAFSFTVEADGSAEIHTASKYTGEIYAAYASLANTPTAAHLLDEDGHDVLCGQNLFSAMPAMTGDNGIGAVVNSTLCLRITGGTADDVGTFIVWVR